MFTSTPPICTGRALELSRKDSNIRYLRHLGNSDIAENLLWVRSFETIEDLRLALLAFKRTYNEQMDA